MPLQIFIQWGKNRFLPSQFFVSLPLHFPLFGARIGLCPLSFLYLCPSTFHFLGMICISSQSSNVKIVPTAIATLFVIMTVEPVVAEVRETH